MKTLLVHYTPDYTYSSLYTEGTVVTEAFSSKETTKYLVPAIEKILIKKEISILDIDHIAVSVGPAPAFALRSALAAINGIKTAQLLQQKQISLFAIDNFQLFYDIYQAKEKNCMVIALYNAYGNDLFYLYRENGIPHRGVASLNEIQAKIHMIQEKTKVIIIGMLSPTQQTILINSSLSFDPQIQLSHQDFCTYALQMIPQMQPVEYLFPLYTKAHEAEKSFKSAGLAVL